MDFQLNPPFLPSDFAQATGRQAACFSHESKRRGERLGLNDDEIAFYDALADKGSARELMGDEQLRKIAQLLVKRVRNSVSIDWTLREKVRAQIRSPSAEGVLRHKAAEAGLAERLRIDSAGTHGYHVGEPPDRRAIRQAREVPDPYYGDLSDYEHALDLIEEAMPGLLRRIRQALG